MQHPTYLIAAVFCPIGAIPKSWSLAAAVAIYVKRNAPDVRVVAVSLQHGGKAGRNTWGHEWMDEVLEVTEDEVTMAINDVYEGELSFFFFSFIPKNQLLKSFFFFHLTCQTSDPVFVISIRRSTCHFGKRPSM